MRDYKNSKVTEPLSFIDASWNIAGLILAAWLVYFLLTIERV